MEGRGAQGAMVAGFGTSDDLVGQVLGWSGMAAALFLFLSPVATMKRIGREGSTLDFSDTPYVVSLLNCLLWVSYAIFTPGRLQPLVTNGIGTLAQAAFLGHMLWFHAKRKRLMLLVKLTVALAGFCLTIIVAKLMGHGHDDSDRQTKFLGTVADVLNGLMYAAPLSAIGTVIRTRSVEFMPLGLSAGTLACSTTWLVYAIWVGDLYIFMPNTVGVLLGVVQMIVYAYYARAGRLNPRLLTECKKELEAETGETPAAARAVGQLLAMH